MRLSFFPALPFLLVGALVALMGQASHRVPSEKEKAFQLVLERCYVCHYLDRPDYKFAPSLKRLSREQDQILMNGELSTDENLSAWIAEGSANMPAFKYTLKPEDIQLILKFLKEGWAADVPMLKDSR